VLTLVLSPINGDAADAETANAETAEKTMRNHQVFSVFSVRFSSVISVAVVSAELV
jgi:hypothetical protein